MTSDFIVGQQYAIGGILTANAFGRTADQSFPDGSGQSSVSSASADATHTSNTFLQALGDFSFVSVSGHDYAMLTTPIDVPEPATLALLGLGLAGMGFARLIVRRDATSVQTWLFTLGSADHSVAARCS